MATEVATPGLGANDPEPADLVIQNARIWSDGQSAFAEFAAIKDGHFIHVCAPDPQLIGPATRRINAKNRIVLPGLIDSHIHMLGGGMQLSRLQLREAADKMIQNHHHRLIVVDDANPEAFPLGIISSFDIVEQMARPDSVWQT